MHPLNPYINHKPNFAQLASRYPDFGQHVMTTATGYALIDFQDPSALRALTRCLLKEDWGLDVDLREDRLVPTIVNRLDYLLHVLDLEPYLDPSSSRRKPPTSMLTRQERSSDNFPATVARIRNYTSRIRVLDIGTGSVAIYPLLIHRLRLNSQSIATEIDPTSYEHGLSVLKTNGIPDSSINLLQPTSEDDILFYLKEDEAKVDVIICNPPFFGSVEEMREGQELKLDPAHAVRDLTIPGTAFDRRPVQVATAADNELITPGGEIAFVGRMIEESLQTRQRCSHVDHLTVWQNTDDHGIRWYTSLIGKYSSLQSLVDRLRTHQIDNYFVKSIKPARTVRWILGWSFTSIRLPDSVTRPDPILPHTSYAKLLPPPNRISHTSLHPPFFYEKLREAVFAVLGGASLKPELNAGFNAVSFHEEDGSILLAPRSNTWSRSARRQAARATTSFDASEQTKGTLNGDQEHTEPLMRVRLSFLAPTPPTSATDGEWRGATLTLHFLEGRDRSVVEAFWKFLLAKAGLVGRNEESAAAGRGGLAGRGRRGGSH